MQKVRVDFSGIAALDSLNYIKCKDAVEEINKEIFKIRDLKRLITHIHLLLILRAI